MLIYLIDWFDLIGLVTFARNDISANDISANDISANDISANDISANDISVKCPDNQPIWS